MRENVYDLCVVGGAGHVGFPLSLIFASKGLSVLVYDINESALESIRGGTVPFREEGAEELLRETLRSGRLHLSSSAAEVAKAGTVVVTIGTPVDTFLNPILQVVKDCVNGLLPYICDEQLLVLRSTVYPGTTELLHKHLVSVGKKTPLAFCPERVVQGLAIREIQEFPQIVSGTTPEAERRAGELFRIVAPDTVILSTMEAEFAKLFSNAYRYVQFAMANQFYMVCNSAGVDYERVLEGIKRNYPRGQDIPRAGFAAGPCLFKDTMQLVAFSGNHFQLGHAAMLVNEGLVLYVIDALAKRHRMEELTVGLLGMAFKADSDDTRASLSYKLKKALAFRAKEVLTTDPYVTTDPALLPLEAVVERSDILILCTPHRQYKDIDARGKTVVDIWGHLGKGTVV
jgi:UDP-N-acetyl-D-mannosaminuronic acid dehydrogenase